MTDKVDISAIEVGDEVTIRAIVTEVRFQLLFSNPRISAETQSGVCTAVFEHEIATHTPQPLQPLAIGDTVRRLNTEGTAVVVGIHEGLAWIKWHNFDSHAVYSVDKLERVS